jgi:citrate synthase
MITAVEPNRLTVAGYALEEIVGRVTLIGSAHLLTQLSLPSESERELLERVAITAATAPAPDLPGSEDEQLSTILARYYLVDGEFATEREPALRAVVALGRTVRFLAKMLGNDGDVDSAPSDGGFGDLIARAVGAGSAPSPEMRDLIEAMAVASVDHGVTPPSAQATILAATVRAPYVMGLASGVGAITDVHGGAGARAAEFFLECVRRSREEEAPVEDAALDLLIERSRIGERIAGLGHRVHTRDPRRDVLWDLAERHGFAGPCVGLSRRIEDLFEEARGFRLPINVDGVIGAVVADLRLPPVAAKALFVLGRVAGLSAHYFEEIRIQPPMRRIRFEDAVYRGPAPRGLDD